ncbi:hypothetical protein SOASR030_06660 [Leminorella grimontii]|uniref:Autotransporter domain-containing protein n=1 Tax=Leminorella grimontii TaxID=82981 RepID=A0AAV5N0I5_9GAMM|nr:autotransporter outer membrane beta-barrel domain-containing protein [Leminorella grimontii]KFC96256.1 hypothetical protein GLGR_1431 [Leminorella grimontii ATCC 33999 = DSM 5078]GKX54554.1 hypothetical protein SOASR030_06660 [Leminorella grimontii]VFS58944.1 P.93 [Leminorella grimontii]
MSNVLRAISAYPKRKKVALSLSIALLGSFSAHSATLNVDGTTESSSGNASYTNTSVSPAIRVTGGGQLTLNHDTTANTNAPTAKAIVVDGNSASSLTVNAPLSIDLGSNTDTVGLRVDKGTFTVMNGGSLVINSTSTGTMGTSAVGVDARDGATVNLGSGAIITTGLAGSELPSGFGIRVQNGSAGANDTKVTANNVQISTGGKESYGLWVWNSVPATGSANTKDGYIILTGENNAIETHGDASHGMATGTTSHGMSHILIGDALAPSSVSVTTHGNGAHGASAAVNTEIVLTGDKQSIVTQGNNAYGIVADASLASSSGVSPTIKIDGNAHRIETSGSQSHAIYVNKGGLVSISNTGTVSGSDSAIKANGADAHAVFAVGQKSSGDRTSVINITQFGGMIESAQGDAFNAQGSAISANLNGVNVSATNGKLINATIVPKSSASGLDGTIGSSVSLIADNASRLVGDVYADIKSSASVSLNNDSVWLGSAQNAKVTTAGGGQWRMTDSSAVTELSNGGVTSFENDPNSPAVTRLFRTLTVSNSLSGNGTFVMRANLQNGSGDRLIVNGTTSGSHTLNVLSDGSQSTHGTERLTLVETADGGGSFTLTSGTVDMGGYTYQLQKEANGKNWQLAAASSGGGNSGSNGGSPTPGGNGGNKAPITSTADAAANFINANYLMSYAETQTLLQRMGELRQDKGQGDFWARGFAGRFDNFAKGQLSGFNMNYHGFQLGSDIRLDAQDNDIYLGVMFGASNASQSYKQGDGGLNAQSFGAYASYMDASGLYFDGLIKYSRMKNSFNVTDSSSQRVSGDDSSNGFSASLEAGKRFYFSPDADGVYLEPQAQLSFSYQDDMTIKASNGLIIDTDAYHSTLGRVSALVGYSANSGMPVNVYLKTGYVTELDGRVSYRLNDAKESHVNRGGWWNNGIGVTTQLNNQHSFYLDAESSTGHRFNQRQINAGYRFSF